MSIGMIIVMVVGAALALFSTGYIVLSLFGVLGYKIYRKIRYGAKMYD